MGRWPRWRARAVAEATLPVGLGSQFRLPPSSPNEIYEDLAIGRPLPFLRVGQVDAFADASVSFADIQLRLDAHKHQLWWYW